MSDTGAGPRLGTIALVVGVALLIYLPSIGGEFLNWDDEWLIVRSPHLDEYSDLGTILDPTAWRTGLGAEYLPVRDLSFWVDRHLSTRDGWEPDPVGFHITNTVLYALVCVLALFLLRALTGSARAALIGALLFAAHPVHVESVAWISERKGLFAAGFLFASLLAYRRSLAGRRRGWFVSSLALFLLAALSKSTVHFVAPLLPCLEWCASRREGRRAEWRRWIALAVPFLVISIVAIALNAHHQGRVDADYGWKGTPPVTALLIATSAAVRQAMHLVLPVGLSAEYERTMGPGAWMAVALVVVLLALVAFVFLRGRRSAPAAMFTLLAWGPVANLLALPNPMADRYMFLPSLGAAGLAGLALAPSLRRDASMRTFSRVGLGLVLAMFALLSVVRADVWTDRMQLWTDAAKRAPGSARAHQNLGMTRLEKHDVEAAFASFDRMLEVEPYESDWYVFVAHRYRAAGDARAALRVLERGVSILPREPDLRIELAVSLLRQAGRVRNGMPYVMRAERHLLTVIEDPRMSDESRSQARATLGGLECMRGRPAQGVALIEQAIREGLAPERELGARGNLRQALLELGRPQEAAEQDRRMRELEERLAERGN